MNWQHILFYTFLFVCCLLTVWLAWDALKPRPKPKAKLNPPRGMREEDLRLGPTGSAARTEAARVARIYAPQTPRSARAAPTPQPRRFERSTAPSELPVPAFDHGALPAWQAYGTEDIPRPEPMRSGGGGDFGGGGATSSWSSSSDSSSSSSNSGD